MAARLLDVLFLCYFDVISCYLEEDFKPFVPRKLCLSFFVAISQL
jgi:hypothetical protein